MAARTTPARGYNCNCSTPMPNQTEARLIHQIAQQDQSALAQLYDRYAPVLFAFAYRILNSLEESEEAVSDVFLQVWKTASSYDPQKSRVDTWLFMLTRSRALDRLRRLARHHRNQVAAQELPTVTKPLDEGLIYRDRYDRVQHALSQLPAPQRQVLELSYFGGMTHTEIALRLNLPLGTIKTRIRLAIAKLKHLLPEM
ncbi:MAG: sigma-70 family RNA polymerase sigma factor [Pseudanabaenaceae cyanobacterium bins.68]|nr:sigma-70 family RNA polymerase sigma factor [Pseudanabaenaceae cyanobacterium bins.68]